MNRIAIRVFLVVFFLGLGFAVVPSFLHHPVTAPVSVHDQTAVVEYVQAGHFGPGHLREHFLKHGYQFGAITEEEYEEDARKLLNTAPGADVLEKTQRDGDIAHYRPSTQEFAVMTPGGRIRTYFKADDRYWYKQ
jgi:pyocin large subunit-like protein